MSNVNAKNNNVTIRKETNQQSCFVNKQPFLNNSYYALYLMVEKRRRKHLVDNTYKIKALTR